MIRCACLLAGFLAFAASAAAAPPVQIAVVTYCGFAPAFVAQEKGFFRKHGVDVALTRSDDAKKHYPLLLEGRYDMLTGALGTSLLYIKNPDDVQYVTVLDDSNGVDGVVVRNEIQSLADLKGKRVGVNIGSISEFYLNFLLRQVGLSEKDVTVVDMSPTEAGRAFLAERVDAAVTWEPFLSDAKRSTFGHLLTDSSTTPGLLADALVASKRFVRERPADARAVVAAWDDAVAFVTDHAAESVEIMARGLGQETKEVAECLELDRLYGGEDARTMFGTKDKPGPLYATLKEAITIWTELGRVKIKVTPEDVFNYSFIGG